HQYARDPIQAAMSDPIFTRYEAHSFTVVYSHSKVGGSSTPTSSSISIARMTASMDCKPYFDNGASGSIVPFTLSAFETRSISHARIASKSLAMSFSQFSPNQFPNIAANDGFPYGNKF